MIADRSFNKKKTENVHPPKERPRDSILMLSQDSVGYGKKVFKNNMEKIVRKDGYQSLIETGRSRRHSQKLDDSVDTVTLCGVFSKSEEHNDAQFYSHRFTSQNTKIGLPLSVRAFKLESMSGLDI